MSKLRDLGKITDQKIRDRNEFLAIRKRLGLTQEELGLHLDRSARAIQDIESGVVKLANVYLLAMRQLFYVEFQRQHEELIIEKAIVVESASGPDTTLLYINRPATMHGDKQQVLKMSSPPKTGADYVREHFQIEPETVAP